MRMGSPVALQEVRSTSCRTISVFGLMFPDAVPSSERGHTSAAADRGTIWTHSDLDQRAGGARQRPTAQRRLCNSNAGNHRYITSGIKKNSKDL